MKARQEMSYLLTISGEKHGQEIDRLQESIKEL
jgi:hypothetical protein